LHMVVNSRDILVAAGCRLSEINSPSASQFSTIAVLRCASELRVSRTIRSADNFGVLFA